MHKTKYFYFIQAYFSLLLLLRLFFVTTLYFVAIFFHKWLLSVNVSLHLESYLKKYSHLWIISHFMHFWTYFLFKRFLKKSFRKKVFNLNVSFAFYIDKNFFWKFVFAWKCRNWYFTWPGFTQYNSSWIYVVINILSKGIEQKSCRFTKPFQQ